MNGNFKAILGVLTFVVIVLGCFFSFDSRQAARYNSLRVEIKENRSAIMQLTRDTHW